MVICLLFQNSFNFLLYFYSQTATDLLVKDSLLLPPTIIEVKRVTDLNKESRAEGAGIKATEFHKKQSVALVAGNSGVATLFRVIFTD